MSRLPRAVEMVAGENSYVTDRFSFYRDQAAAFDGGWAQIHLGLDTSVRHGTTIRAPFDCWARGKILKGAGRNGADDSFIWLAPLLRDGSVCRTVMVGIRHRSPELIGAGGKKQRTFVQGEVIATARKTWGGYAPHTHIELMVVPGSPFWRHCIKTPGFARQHASLMCDIYRQETDLPSVENAAKGEKIAEKVENQIKKWNILSLDLDGRFIVRGNERAGVKVYAWRETPVSDVCSGGAATAWLDPYEFLPEATKKNSLE